MDHIHPNHNIQVVKAEYSQYQAGYTAGIMHPNLAPLRAILRSLTQPQRD